MSMFLDTPLPGPTPAPRDATAVVPPPLLPPIGPASPEMLDLSRWFGAPQGGSAPTQSTGASGSGTTTTQSAGVTASKTKKKTTKKKASTPITTAAPAPTGSPSPTRTIPWIPIGVVGAALLGVGLMARGGKQKR